MKNHPFNTHQGNYYSIGCVRYTNTITIASDYSFVQFNSLVNRSITIKTCFGHSQGPASGQNSVCENSRKTFSSHSPHTHSLTAWWRKKIYKRRKIWTLIQILQDENDIVNKKRWIPLLFLGWMPSKIFKVLEIWEFSQNLWSKLTLLKGWLIWMSRVIWYPSIIETFLTKSFYFLSSDEFLIFWVISILTTWKVQRKFIVQSVTAGKLQIILPDSCTSLIIWREIVRRSNGIVNTPNWISAADDQKTQVMGRERGLWNKIYCRNRECRAPSVCYEMQIPLRY